MTKRDFKFLWKESKLFNLSNVIFVTKYRHLRKWQAFFLSGPVTFLSLVKKGDMDVDTDPCHSRSLQYNDSATVCAEAEVGGGGVVQRGSEDQTTGKVKCRFS